MVESYPDEQGRPRRRRGRKVGIVLLVLAVIIWLVRMLTGSRKA